MSWTSRVREHALMGGALSRQALSQKQQAAVTSAPVSAALNWQSGATAIGHFSPNYTATPEPATMRSISSTRCDTSSPGVAGLPLAVNESSASVPLLVSPIPRHASTARHTADSDSCSVSHSLLMTSSGSVIVDARSMDPYVARERQVCDAFNALRRDPATFASEEIFVIDVVVPPCDTSSHIAAESVAVEGVADQTAGKKLAPTQSKKSKSETPLPTEETSDADCLAALQRKGLLHNVPRTLKAPQVAKLVDGMTEILSSKVIPPDAPLTPHPLRGNTPHAVAEKDKAKGPKKAVDPSHDEVKSEALIPSPVVLNVLKSYRDEVQTALTLRTGCLTALHQCVTGENSPLVLSRGLSLAAREVASIIALPQRSLLPNNGRRMSNVAGLEEKEAQRPSCGDYIVQREAERFGRCDPSLLSAVVVFGLRAPRDVARLWYYKALQEGSLGEAKFAPFSKSGKFTVGVGWQKHSVFGAVTVCLAAPSFEELRFTTTRTNLPNAELSRYINSGLLSDADRHLFPIRCDVSRYHIEAVAPRSHPVFAESNDVQLLFDVPSNVELACTVVQSSCPPQTPFHGRRPVDAMMRNSRRNGKPLKEVSMEPKCSTSTSLVDFLPQGTTRITVRLASLGIAATVHIFAKLCPLETSFHKALSVSIQPPDEDNCQCSCFDGLPLVTEAFAKYRACLVSPLRDTIPIGDAATFQVYLPEGVDKCVIRGSHGETQLVAHEQHRGSSMISSSMSNHRPPNTSSIPSIATSNHSLEIAAAGGGVMNHSRIDFSPRRSANVLYSAVLQRPKEGPLRLWVDGIVLAEWVVAYPV